MAQLLGHTLGTPGYSLAEALDLFADSGLDGAEIIWQNGYKSGIPEDDNGEVRLAVKQQARKLDLRIGCLTPYVTELNSPDESTRLRDIARIQTAIQVASDLECPRMRIYAGTLVAATPVSEIAPRWSYLVDSLARLGSIASSHGVVLCVENHFSTMTVSANDTLRLVAEVDSPGVGILYDQANLAFTHREDFEEAIRLQAPWIRHVHVKDLEFIDPHRELAAGAVANIDKANRVHMSRMIGDGILDWAAIIARLRFAGYDGSYSLEYEYRWNPEDLPEPVVGFPESAKRLRALVEAASPPATSTRNPAAGVPQSLGQF
jgi:L-ribulose-5-phosphate 3-epimerase